MLRNDKDKLKELMWQVYRVCEDTHIANMYRRQPQLYYTCDLEVNRTHLSNFNFNSKQGNNLYIAFEYQGAFYQTTIDYRSNVDVAMTERTRPGYNGIFTVFMLGFSDQSILGGFPLYFTFEIYHPY